MKKLIRIFVLLPVLCCSAVAHSQSVEETDPGVVVLEIWLYRPVGFAVTIIGAGAFIGLSPLTALSSIPEPHDAFAKTAGILILAPAAYTFIRPIGNRDFPYHVTPYRHKLPATPNRIETHTMPATPGQRPIAPPRPDEQQPHYPETGKGL
jgi:hypothetical protein